jgi:hypothetical protein
MTSFTSLLTGLVVIAGLVGLAVYFFGIPPEVKRKMENAALKTMGENKASFMLKGINVSSPLTLSCPAPLPTITSERAAQKPRDAELLRTNIGLLTTSQPDQISKMPEADQQDIKDLKSSLSNLAGGATRNRAGEKAGDLGDDLTKSFTGR